MSTLLQAKAVRHYGAIAIGDIRSNIAYKVTYVLLQMLDLWLTLWAVNAGFKEMNPVMNGMLDSPLQLLLVKFLIPLLIVRFVPGKWLIPGILVLAFVLIWNVQQLMTVLF